MPAGSEFQMGGAWEAKVLSFPVGIIVKWWLGLPQQITLLSNHMLSHTQPPTRGRIKIIWVVVVGNLL